MEFILSWLTIWQFWLLLAVILLLIEINLDGSFYIFLPTSVASLVLTLIYLPLFYSVFIPKSWQFSIVLFSALSLILSVLIRRFTTKPKTERDINQY